MRHAFKSACAGLECKTRLFFAARDARHAACAHLKIRGKRAPHSAPAARVLCPVGRHWVKALTTSWGRRAFFQASQATKIKPSSDKQKTDPARDDDDAAALLSPAHRHARPLPRRRHRVHHKLAGFWVAVHIYFVTGGGAAQQKTTTTTHPTDQHRVDVVLSFSLSCKRVL